jgi:virion core protein
LNRYTQYQTAQAIPLAAQNEGGLAGLGAGIGVGAGIGQNMAAAMSTGLNNANAANDIQARLAQLKTLHDQGLISADDYEKAKAEVLKKLTS